MKQRLQKIISESGFCSRRAAEELIKSNRVSINGEIASLGISADIETDIITIDNTPLQKPKRRTYIMLNKPRGFVTTMSDEKGRPTVRELTSDVGARVFPVGRLDFNSEGLLIMTDDGALAQKLTHPSHEISKTYHVRVRGQALEKAIDILRSPLIIDGIKINPAQVRLISEDGDLALLAITITQGINRQIRKMCEAADLRVLRLKRVSEGNLDLGDLPSGKWRYLTVEEIEKLQY